jgi:hypothetical protein
LKVLVPVIFEIDQTKLTGGLTSVLAFAKEAVELSLNPDPSDPGFIHEWGGQGIHITLAKSLDPLPFCEPEQAEPQPLCPVWPEADGEPSLPEKTKGKLETIIRGVAAAAQKEEYRWPSSPPEGAYVTQGNFACELEWIGEGMRGDFDEDDPHDKKLLRFSILQRDDEHSEFGRVRDGDFCTALTLPRPHKDIEIAAKLILGRVRGLLEQGKPIKRVCEALSHANWKWVATCRRTKIPIDPLTVGQLS